VGTHSTRAVPVRAAGRDRDHRAHLCAGVSTSHSVSRDGTERTPWLKRTAASRIAPAGKQPTRIDALGRGAGAAGPLAHESGVHFAREAVVYIARESNARVARNANEDLARKAGAPLAC
jgi:hypothetical protein